MSRAVIDQPLDRGAVAALLSKMRFGRFGRNILSNAGGNAINSVLQLGLLFVLFRGLADSIYAAFLLATFLIGLLEMASDYGTRIWASREFATDANPRIVLKRSVQAKLCFTMISGLLFSLVPSNTLPSTAYWLCVLIATTQPSSDPFLWLLRGKERLDVEAGVVLLFRSIVVVAIVLASFVSQSLHLFLLIWLSGNIARIVTEWRHSTAGLLNARPGDSTQTIPQLSYVLKHVFPIGTAFVLTCLFQRAVILLLEAYSSPQTLKYFGTAYKIVNTSGFIATSIVVASFPLLTRAISECDRDRIRAVVQRKLLLVTALFFPPALLVVLASAKILAFGTSPELESVLRVVVLLMPGLYVSCVNMGLKYTLNAFALNWQDVVAVLFGLTSLSIVTIWLLEHGGATAAAIGWFAGESTLLTVRFLLLWHHGHHRGIPAITISAAASLLSALAVILGI